MSVTRKIMELFSVKKISSDKKTSLIDPLEQKTIDYPAPDLPQIHKEQQDIIEIHQLKKFQEATDAFVNLKSELAHISAGFSNQNTDHFQVYLSNANRFEQIIKDYLKVTPVSLLKKDHEIMKRQFDLFQNSSRLGLYNDYNKLAVKPMVDDKPTPGLIR